LICFFEGPKEDFKPKIKVLGANRNLLVKRLSFYNRYTKYVPHSSGIASSASGMAALDDHEFRKVLKS
jgi:mevalonate pyrophosphate decarboxylase